MEQAMETPVVDKVVLMVKQDNQMLVEMVVETNHVVLKVVEMVVDWVKMVNLQVKQLDNQEVLVLP